LEFLYMLAKKLEIPIVEFFKDIDK